MTVHYSPGWRSKQSLSAALQADNKDESADLHGEYRQDKRALRGARTSAAGGRDEGWQADAEMADAHNGGGKAITLSSLPRGYWATLFNLEVVKARNRPIEPPKKPEAAPFFLATVHREGEVAPSFPEVGSTAAAAAAAAGKGKPRIAAASDVEQSMATIPGDDDVPDLPAGGDAWSDDDEAEDGGMDNEKDAVVAVGKRKLAGEEDAPGAPPPARRSRILKQMKTAAKAGSSGPSRCRLADLLLECDQADVDRVDIEGNGGENVRFGAVMAYMKQLPPPMVDVDMSLLCQGEWDEEGVHVVGLAVEFLLEELRWVFQVVRLLDGLRLADGDGRACTPHSPRYFNHGRAYYGMALGIFFLLPNGAQIAVMVELGQLDKSREDTTTPSYSSSCKCGG